MLYLEQKARQPSTNDQQRRTKLSNSLERLVALNPFAKTNPVQWERELREDRTLSGRE